MFQLQRINKQTNTDAVQKEGEKKPENADLTGWLICATWSGDVEQAGRRLEFDLAYTTRDKAWQNPGLELGDEVLFIHIDDKTQQTVHLFQGRIFGRSRESGSSVMHFTAFDNIVYLAKSRITKKYTNVTVADAIRQTINRACRTHGVPLVSASAVRAVSGSPQFGSSRRVMWPRLNRP